MKMSNYVILSVAALNPSFFVRLDDEGTVRGDMT